MALFMNGKSVQLAALRRQVAPPAFTDHWAPMIGLVGQLARQPQVALPSFYQWIGNFMAKLFN